MAPSGGCHILRTSCFFSPTYTFLPSLLPFVCLLCRKLGVAGSQIRLGECQIFVLVAGFSTNLVVASEAGLAAAHHNSTLLACVLPMALVVRLLLFARPGSHTRGLGAQQWRMRLLGTDGGFSNILDSRAPVRRRTGTMTSLVVLVCSRWRWHSQPAAACQTLPCV
jgi:hypothetical protein